MNLVENIDILAVAAGFDRANFLSKVRIDQSSYSHLLTNKLSFSERQTARIERFVKAQNDAWLETIYHKACYKKLERYDIILFSEKPFKNPSPYTVLSANLRAFRYVFELSTSELPSSYAVVRDIEKNTRKCKEDTYYLIYEKLERYVRTKDSKLKDIFYKGCKYPIITKIPLYVRI